MSATRRKQVTGVFREHEAAVRARADLEQHGFAEHVSLAVTHEDATADSPGNDETIAAQNRAGFATLGTAIGLLFGALIVLAFLGLHPNRAITWGVPVGLGFLGRLVGHYVGSRFRLGYRTVEDELPTEEEKAVLRIEVDTETEYQQALDILKRHGAAGPGRPLI